MHGEVTIGGAKNAVLPILAATLLTAEPCVIRRVPNLSDVKFMGQILTWLGAQVRTEGNTIRVQAKKIKGAGDYDLIRKMREQPVKVGVRARASDDRYWAIAKHALICLPAIAVRVTQYLATIELIEPIGASTF